MTKAGTRGWWRKRTRGVGSRMGKKTGRYFKLNKVLPLYQEESKRGNRTVLLMGRPVLPQIRRS